MAKSVSVRMNFDSEQSARDWFETLRDHGHVPEVAGLRHIAPPDFLGDPVITPLIISRAAPAYPPWLGRDADWLVEPSSRGRDGEG